MSLLVNAGRDFLNILWGVLVLIKNPFTRKLMIIGSLLSYMLSKIVEINFNNMMLKIPASILCYYCLLRILNYCKNNILNEDDPLLHGCDIEKMRVKKALSYLSITSRYKYLETPTNVEFLVDWKNFRENKRYKLAQAQYDSDWESDWESDSDSDDSDNDNGDKGIKNTKLFLNETCDKAIKLTDFIENIKTSVEKIDDELIECDECGEKDINPSDLSEGDCNLSMCGKGYAHEECMSEELKEVYNNSLNNTKNHIIDDELEIINDTMIEEEEEESIKRGWFDWAKYTKSKNV